MSLPPLGPIRYLTVHCTATPEGRPNTAAEVTAWDRQRFGQPSYHFVVELDGNIVQTLPLTSKGAHTGGHNTGNVGISYVGGTETLAAGGKPKDTRTPAQKLALANFIRQFIAHHPGVQVLGHRDWPNVNKACPSFDVKEWLKGVL